MKIVKGFANARATIFHRPPLDQYPVPPAVSNNIKRTFGEDLTPLEVVERIVAEVRSQGDKAVREYTRGIDGIELSTFEVHRRDIKAARVSKELMSALELAAERIRNFHLGLVPKTTLDFAEGGLGRLIRPLDRVGLYVPGGTAAYPSTVLMTAIPARVAGVKEIFITTPPGKQGTVPESLLVAARLSGVDRIFKIGGAQAIAAMAWGTETIPKVDKICGPGNIFVMLAKKIVYGMVAIDGLYGPTETVILADDSANPVLCAADLLAQAEHDPMASALMVTNSAVLAKKVSVEVNKQLKSLERQQIARESITNRGGIAVVETLEEAFELVNHYAPEHLGLMVKNAWNYIGQIRHTGGIFLGDSSPEAIGDYTAGPSHVMPTSGSARFGSPLGVEDFVKSTSLVALNEATLNMIGPAASTLARVEGLTAHVQAIEKRLRRNISG